jgi:hypothetical protein
MENTIMEFVEEVKRLKEKRLDLSKKMRVQDPDSRDYKTGLELVASVNKQIHELIRRLADEL